MQSLRVQHFGPEVRELGSFAVGDFRNRARIGNQPRVRGQDRIFALGDLALIEDQPLPQLAQPALQTGRHAARQIRRLAGGEQAVAFEYRDKGIMATIGRRSAVVELPHRIRVRGTLAWLAWLALHLLTLLGNRNRLSALLNLSWRYLTWGHGGGVIVGDDPLPFMVDGPLPVGTERRALDGAQARVAD